MFVLLVHGVLFLACKIGWVSMMDMETVGILGVCTQSLELGVTNIFATNVVEVSRYFPLTPPVIGDK